MTRYLLFATLLISTNHLGAQKSISIDSLSHFTADTVKVCAKVEGSIMFKPPKKRTTYLNLGAPYPNQKLTVVIFEKDLPRFPFLPADYYKGLNVCVTGVLTKFQNKIQMIVNKPENIVVEK